MTPISCPADFLVLFSFGRLQSLHLLKIFCIVFYFSIFFRKFSYLLIFLCSKIAYENVVPLPFQLNKLFH